MPPIVLTPTAIELFAAASHDRNPLHGSPDYAHRTMYGKPVAYGVLGLMAALAHLPAATSICINRIKANFHRPMFASAPYQVDVIARADGGYSIRVRDGSLLVLSAVISLEAQADPPPLLIGKRPYAPREVARKTELSLLESGYAIDFSYVPTAEPFDRLFELLELASRGIDPRTLIALMACSYCVGMELPGELAIFSSLDLRFEATSIDGPPQMRAEVTSFDRRFERCSSLITFDGFAARAHGTIDAFVRTASPWVDRELLENSITAADISVDRLAVVVGASRGLGASIAVALALRGYQVVALYARSQEQAMRVAKLARGAMGAIHPMHLDASSPEACEQLASTVASRWNRAIDLLVCSASPPLLPAAIDSSHFARIQAFLASAFALVGAPMAAFLPQLASSRGALTLISSSAVNAAPADWPHYVAAKSATEALVRAASAAHPTVRFLIARPPRLMTDYVSSLDGGDALRVEPVADAIVSTSASMPPGVTVLENFAPRSESRARTLASPTAT